MIGCFGKVPASADFISLHGAAEEVREFDQWLQDSLAAPLHRNDWRAAFDRLPVCFFCFRARSGNWLLGGFISSRDASERRYPFMIFQLLNAAAMPPLANPFTLGELFCLQVKPLLHRAVQHEPVPRLLERVAALRPLHAQDITLFQRVHEKFLANFNLADISQALQPAYPAFAQRSALAGLHTLNRHWQAGLAVTASLPLPAEHGLKNPVADLWVTWLARLGARTLPAASVLADDFMRPRLLCFTSPQPSSVYQVLNGLAPVHMCVDVRACRDEPLPLCCWPDDRLPLKDFIARFVETLDVTPV